ncbi:MAG TPA: 3-dehydroquinate synthase [Candidatus Dojkabacteria bacterium]
MLKRISTKIKNSEQRYEVLIGKTIIESIPELFHLKNYSKIAVITDENLQNSFLPIIEESLERDLLSIILKPGENEKNIRNVEFIWNELIGNNFDRSSLVINLGGGVIGDMGGFAASTFMRGIDFINIPTTLLAQVDASIGGKTAIDFHDIKNIIGTFDQPKMVLIDIETLETLPLRELRSGFAEIIKHGIIADKEYFDSLKHYDAKKITSDWIKLIEGSVKIKKRIVESDVRESGKRKFLNFGHTVGHAIEAILLESQNPITHGEAIALGMIAESRIALYLGRISDNEFSQIEDMIKFYGLPVRTELLNLETIKTKMQKDKKNKEGEIKWVLPNGIGEVESDLTVDDEIVEKSINCIFS